MRQAGEARLVEGIEVFGIASTTQLGAFLQGTPMPPVNQSRCWVSGRVTTRTVVSIWQMWLVK